MEFAFTKNNVISFLWQHLLLTISLFIMTLGVALCVRSNLGSSVISTIPFVMTLAGVDGLAPELTIGQYTYIMNFVFVVLQVLVLRRRFEIIQLLQLVIGFLFGFLLDINMLLTSGIACDTILRQCIAQVAGSIVLGIGIAFELRCGSVTMPGEGITVAVSKVTGMPFPKTKIIVDTALVAVAVAIGYCYFGHWLWNVTGPGTLFAMIFVGVVVRFTSAHIGWFDRVLDFTPGFRRHIYGLARFIYKLQKKQTSSQCRRLKRQK